MVKQTPHEWTEETKSPDIGLIINIKSINIVSPALLATPKFSWPKP
jgi:hypothetical protein